MDNINAIAQTLIKGNLVVLPTDTIYGIVACAHNQKSVNTLYQAKSRDSNKPSIILISSYKDMLNFGIDAKWQAECRQYWPGPYSLIVPTNRKDIEYLTCGTGTLALRLPNNKELQNLIDLTGPLAAPSANPEGLAPATNIKQAKVYFGNTVSTYVDGGEITNNQPSHLINLTTHQTLR